MIKLLVVDDSAFMRVAVRKMVEQDPGIKLVGEARDGEIALRMIEELNPDVITMDIEMPNMDGLEATRRIMEKMPRPIIMLSSLTQVGAPTTFKALDLGAVDFISKASSFVQLDIVHIQTELLAKINYWGQRRLPVMFNAGSKRPPLLSTMPISPFFNQDKGYIARPELVAIGVSTGGPRTLPILLRAIGRLSCPLVVAQHMPTLFTRSFAQHLHEQIGGVVVEGEKGQELKPGHVVILPGGVDGLVRRQADGKLVISVQDPPNPPSVHPSVDLLFSSCAKVVNKGIGVILTGMGSDGSRGAKDLRVQGWPVLVQDPATCVVGGMPEAAIEAGVASESLTLERIGQKLQRLAGT